MLGVSDTFRVPLPESYGDGNGATLEFGVFSCTEMRLISNDGASGLVYEGISRDYYGTKDAAPARLIVKECYPLDAAASLHREGNALVLDQNAPLTNKLAFAKHALAYKDAFVRHTSIYQGAARESVSVPSRSREANGTIYLVCDVSNGKTLDKIAPELDLHTRVEITHKLVSALSLLHQEGYIYLDLKPDNVLITQANGQVTGVRLFDFDSTVRLEDLRKKKAIISGSDGWSSYEQMHEARLLDVSTQSDFYSIGALLFWFATGRIPSYTEVIHAYGEWNLSADDLLPEFSNISEATLTSINNILNHTLTVDPDARFESDEELKLALKLLAEYTQPASDAFTDVLGKASTDIKEAFKVAIKKEKNLALKFSIAGLIAVVLIAIVACSAFSKDDTQQTAEQESQATQQTEQEQEQEQESEESTIEASDGHIVGTWTGLFAEDANGKKKTFDDVEVSLIVKSDGTFEFYFEENIFVYTWVLEKIEPDEEYDAIEFYRIYDGKKEYGYFYVFLGDDHCGGVMKADDSETTVTFKNDVYL